MKHSIILYNTRKYYITLENREKVFPALIQWNYVFGRLNRHVFSVCVCACVRVRACACVLVCVLDFNFILRIVECVLQALFNERSVGHSSGHWPSLCVPSCQSLVVMHVKHSEWKFSIKGIFTKTFHELARNWERKPFIKIL
jgi:hypothetical protein